MSLDNGLDISENQFLKLPSREQNVILYKNIREIRISVKSYKFQQKLQYAWLAALTVAIGLSKFMGVL